MVEDGKGRFDRILRWWDGLGSGEKKVFGGLGGLVAVLFLISVADNSWPMIIVIGAIGAYFFNEWRKARAAMEAQGETAGAGEAAQRAVQSMTDQARAAASTVATKASELTESASTAKPVETVKAAAKPTTEKPKKAEAKKAAPKKGPAETSGAASTGGPERLSKPRGGKADDLKMLKGVGPRLETILNEMGFYHYDQIAAWTPEQVEMIDQEMTGVNKGRASRDGWVEQAKVLARGGSAEAAKRVAES